jgi:phosphotriesterase-related protein
MKGKVMTVLGSVEPDALGITLTHEHLLADVTAWWRPPDKHSPVTRTKLAYSPVSIELLGDIRRGSTGQLIRDDYLLDDLDLAIVEAMEFKNAGGGTVVEVSSRGLGRDPNGMQTISRATGLHVVCGTGYYLKGSHLGYVAEKSADELAQIITRDIVEGIDGSPVRSGIIGEVGLSARIDPDEEKALRAACRAQRKTGVPLSIHYLTWLPENESLRILDIVEEEGCDLSRLIMGHQDSTTNDGMINVELMKTIARRKAYVQFDTFGVEVLMLLDGYLVQFPHDLERVKALKQIADAGYLSNVLISHDIAHKHHLKRYGGYGYAHILRNVLPVFKAKGFTDEDVHTIMVENPKRALTVD